MPPGTVRLVEEAGIQVPAGGGPDEENEKCLHRSHLGRADGKTPSSEWLITDCEILILASSRILTVFLPIPSGD
ncbi:unnamed protein product [Penicillium roqueforti FM164]|uniref:Genomic scaffold, ProqFM164S02 n=1 Tax=Penicillium roqueforti (strain FM164) TaxID=1365484 RepID=W6QG00_PENRF|nr:unnamed protein product [Penicillium roqueforti FM164]